MFFGRRAGIVAVYSSSTPSSRIRIPPPRPVGAPSWAVRRGRARKGAGTDAGAISGIASGVGTTAGTASSGAAQVQVQARQRPRRARRRRVCRTSLGRGMGPIPGPTWTERRGRQTQVVRDDGREKDMRTRIRMGYTAPTTTQRKRLGARTGAWARARVGAGAGAGAGRGPLRPAGKDTPREKAIPQDGRIARTPGGAERLGTPPSHRPWDTRPPRRGRPPARPPRSKRARRVGAGGSRTSRSSRPAAAAGRGRGPPRRRHPRGARPRRA